MLSGEEIYDRLTRVSEPADYLKSLSDADMRKLLVELELLPNVHGVPGVIAILADEEVQTRFKRQTEESNK